MKILFIITRSDTVGGAQVHVRDLGQSLIQQEHQVLVITGIGGFYNRVLDNYGIPSLVCETLQKPISLRQDWLTLSFLRQTICQFQPDIVSTHSSKAGILGRLACKLTNTSCIFTAHGWAFTEGVPQPSRITYQALERLAEPLADKIICVSEHDRLIGIKLGMNPSRLVTVHNGMPDIYREKRANPDHSNPVRIVMIARFDRQKDHLTLIKAFQKISGAQLDLVGDGPNLEPIKAIVTQLGIADRVKFWGYSSNIVEILSQAQIFTLISHWEGFPRTIIEAMRAGLPVVASNVGGVEEAVVEGITGYCIPCGDVDTLREKLSHLVENAKLRSEMGSRGRERYESAFTFQQMFDKTFKVYENLLTKEI